MASIKNVIAIASGKGGVGKSTVSVNLALSLKQQGYAVGLLDADIYGPSIPLMMNAVGQKPTTPDNKTFTPIISYGLELMSIGFIVLKDEATIWRGPMMSQAISQLLFQTNWSDLDYLIIDFPPGTGDAQLTLSQKADLTGAILVTTPQDMALIDVKKPMEAFKKLKVPIIGLIENMSYFICDDCGSEHHLFGQNKIELFVKENSINLLGKIPLDPSFVEAGDNGEPLYLSSEDELIKNLYGQLSLRVEESIATLEKPKTKIEDIQVQLET